MFFVMSWYHESNVHNDQQGNTQRHFHGPESFPTICGYQLLCATLTRFPWLGPAAESRRYYLAS